MSQSAISQFLSFSLLLLANGLFVYVVIVSGHEQLHGENSLLENFQVMLLATGGLLYLWLSNKAITTARFLYLGLALLSLSFVLRELDMERLPVPGVIQLLGSGMIRNLLLALLWGWFALAWFAQVSGKRQFISELLLTRSCQLLIPAALLLICSALLDRGLIGLDRPRLFEELAETNAYLIMLLPALLGFWPTHTMQPAAHLAACHVVRDDQGNRYPP